MQARKLASLCGRKKEKLELTLLSFPSLSVVISHRRSYASGYRLRETRTIHGRFHWSLSYRFHLVLLKRKDRTAAKFQVQHITYIFLYVIPDLDSASIR